MNMTSAVSVVRASRVALLALMALELVVLYLLTSGIFFRLTANQGRSPLGSTALSHMLLVGLPSVLAFILPSAIGALARSWQSAIALAVAPWWLVLVLHAGTLLDATATSPYQPEWLSLSIAASLLISLALFMVLGFLGWLARHIAPEVM